MTAIEVQDLTKRFGELTAVDHLTFRVEPGTVTGFLGNNGAGKTTTMRMLLGLIHPTEGTATIDGRRYRDLPHPTRAVGAVLEPARLHPGRRARHHLLALAQASGIDAARVDVVLDQVGLADAADRRTKGFSLGMRQRLAIAAALLGDPGVLILDEPTNGLDPQGVRWVRGFLRRLAGEGRTVLVSSHHLAEVSLSVDDVIVIDRGRLVAHEVRPDMDDLEARFFALTAPEGDLL